MQICRRNFHGTQEEGGRAGDLRDPARSMVQRDAESEDRDRGGMDIGSGDKCPLTDAAGKGLGSGCARVGWGKNVDLRCPSDKYESAISPPLPKSALTKEEVEVLSHVVIKEYLYSSNLKVHADPIRRVALRGSWRVAGIRTPPNSISGLCAEGAPVCEGAQQRLAALCARAEGHWDDTQTQDYCPRAHWPAAVPPREGRHAAPTAVLQRVSNNNDENISNLVIFFILIFDMPFFFSQLMLLCFLNLW